MTKGLNLDWRVPHFFNSLEPELKLYECPEYNYRVMVVLTITWNEKRFQLRRLVDRVDWQTMADFFRWAQEAVLKKTTDWDYQI